MKLMSADLYKNVSDKKPTPALYMGVFTILMSIVFVISGKANTYYFSTSAGDDSRSAIDAQKTATPWKSLNKLNTFFTNLQPGDSVLFKRGEIFDGLITITQSGTLQKPIVIAAYGSGEKPVINGLTTLNNWIDKGDGIYESYNTALGSTPGIVLINNIPQEMGRYPNSNSNNNGYLTIGAYVKNWSVTDYHLSSSPNWTGAEIVIRKKRWKIDRSLIASHTGNTINYVSGTPDYADTGYGYFIQNDIKTLDQFGEWYYNPSSKKMYVYFGNKAPAACFVEASAYKNIITTHNISYVTVSELTIQGAMDNGIKIEGGNNIAIQHCNIIFSGKTGIDVKNHTNIKIESCIVSDANEGGINILGDGAILRYNKVKNIGLFPGMGTVYGNGFTALTCFSTKALVEHNKITNIGYLGIHFKQDSCTIQYNYIDSFCITTDDGGGIYTHNENNNTGLIKGNIITNGIGAPAGTNALTSNAAGIYLDDNTSGLQVESNTVNKCDKGLFIHNANRLAVINNTLFDNEVQAYFKHDELGAPVRNIKFENNILFSKQPSQLVLAAISTSNDIKEMGSFENNYYARPLDDSLIIFTSFADSDQTKTQYFTLEGWQQRYGKDKKTKRCAVQIPPYTVNGITDLNKFTKNSSEQIVRGIFANNCRLFYNSNPNTLYKNFLQVTPERYKSSIAMSIGELKPDKQYLLRFNIAGQADYNSIGVFLRYGSAPYTPLTTVMYKPFSKNISGHEVLFVPSTYQQSGTLVFTVNDTATYWINNIGIYEANVTKTNPDKFIRFEYNSSDSTKMISVNDVYIDLKGNLYSRNIKLPPYSAVILMKRPHNTLKNTGLISAKAMFSGRLNRSSE